MNSLALVLYLAVATVNNLVQPLGGAPQILIPVAGNVPGLNTTHFRSDIAVINLRNVTQRDGEVNADPEGHPGEERPGEERPGRGALRRP